MDEKQMAKRKVAGRSCGGRVYLQEGGKKERDGGGGVSLFVGGGSCVS